MLQTSETSVFPESDTVNGKWHGGNMFLLFLLLVVVVVFLSLENNQRMGDHNGTAVTLFY